MNIDSNDEPFTTYILLKSKDWFYENGLDYVVTQLENFPELFSVPVKVNISKLNNNIYFQYKGINIWDYMIEEFYSEEYVGIRWPQALI